MPAQDINSVQELLEYIMNELQSRRTRLEEIIAGGETPSEEDLTIGGPDRDNPLSQIWATIIGRIEDVPPEIANDDARLTGYLNRLVFEEIGRIGQEIEDAGGWAQWVEDNYPDPEEDEDEDDTEDEGTDSIADLIRQAAEDAREREGEIPEDHGCCRTGDCGRGQCAE